MTNTIVQNSFSSGEISPTMYGRTDMNKYANGLESCKNFFVDFRGGVSNRAGTAHVGRTSDQALAGNVRIVPFQVSTEDTYVLEFGHLYMRAIREGGYVTHPAQTLVSMTLANPGVFTVTAHGLANNDRVFLDGVQPQISDSIYIVQNVTANTFTLTTEDGTVVDTSALAAYVSGGTVAEIFSLTTPYEDDEIMDLDFSQSVDTMTISHKDHPQRDLIRVLHYSWTLDEIEFTSSVTPPGSLSGAGSAVTDPWEYGYVVTAVDVNGEESTQSNIARVQVDPGKPVHLSWDQVADVSFYAVYKTLPADNSTGIPTGATYGFIGNAFGTAMADTNITPDFTKQPPKNQDPFAPGAIVAINVTNGGSAYTSSTLIFISDAQGTGAEALQQESGGSIRSVPVLYAGRNYLNPSITAGSPGTGFTATATLSPASGTYPRLSVNFQQRRVFASSENDPATIWGSKPGLPRNFDVTIPSNSGDAFSFTLSSTQVNQIRSMIAMPGGLVLFTGSAVWQLSGGGINAPVLPTNAIANPQSYHGAGTIRPVTVDYNILYLTPSHTVVHELTYNAIAQNYTTIDITALAQHLFRQLDKADPVVAWAYAHVPFKVLYAVQRSGRMLILTYMKEQEVAGWSRHFTRGNFRDVCVIRESERDTAYVITQRYINGAWRRSVERLVPREFPNGAEDAWFLDGGAELSMPTYDTYLVFSAVSGTGVTVTASSATFAAGDVGKIIRAGGGRAEIVGYTSSTEVTVDFQKSITDLIPEMDTEVANIIGPGTWTMTEPVSTLYGLNHLEGEVIKVLADGAVIENLEVVNGSVELPHPATRVIAGLPYTAEIKPLPIAGNPPVMGRLKKISRATIKVASTRSLKVGHTEETLTPVKERAPFTTGPLELFTGEHEITVDPKWGRTGQLLFRQSDPLPATILAIAYEAVLGDH